MAKQAAVDVTTIYVLKKYDRLFGGCLIMQKMKKKTTQRGKYLAAC